MFVFVSLVACFVWCVTCTILMAIDLSAVYAVWHLVALTWGYFEVDAVAVVSVAAVDVEQALCTEAVEGLSRGHQLVPSDADTYVLLYAVNEGDGSHTGSIGLALEAGPVTLGSGAVTPKSCRDRWAEETAQCEKTLFSRLNFDLKAFQEKLFVILSHCSWSVFVLP